MTAEKALRAWAERNGLQIVEIRTDYSSASMATRVFCEVRTNEAEHRIVRFEFTNEAANLPGFWRHVGNALDSRLGQ